MMNAPARRDRAAAAAARGPGARRESERARARGGRRWPTTWAPPRSSSPTRTGVSARRLAAFRPRRPILAYSRVPETTRRLHLVWGVRAIDLTVPAGNDPLHAALEAARRDLPPGRARGRAGHRARGRRGVPSLVNAITF